MNPWDSSGCGKVLKSLPAGNGGATLKITTSKAPKAQVLAGGESEKNTGCHVKLFGLIEMRPWKRSDIYIYIYDIYIYDIYIYKICFLELYEPYLNLK